jgi:RNA polymerase sigma-70 factor, ECF subfamily
MSASALRGCPAGSARRPQSVRDASRMSLSEQEQRQAFESEMLPHLEAAYRLARALTGHQQDAEDLVQDTYLRAFSGFARYEHGTNARAWLLTIMRRAFLNTRRRARARPLLSPLETREGTVDTPDTQTPGPEEQVMRALERRVVLDALADLPEVYRSALALVDLAGMRYAEAAQILGCPLGTVMSRLHRGRLALGRRLRNSLIRSEEP